MRSAIPLLFLLCTANLAAQPPGKPAAAPPLRDCKVTPTTDLGLWDDIFVPNNQDYVILRREDQLFSLAMTPTGIPKKIARTAAAVNTRIAAGAVVDGRCWLFLHSKKAAPYAVDAKNGTVVKFDIPGLDVPGSQAPGFQSHVIVPHARAAVLMVAGGDKTTWPRPGNRPVYFWMDLASGKVVRFPVGWDLSHFSADQRIAVFETANAIEMATGKRTDAIPDRRKESHVPFSWTDRDMVKPLYDRREGEGDADFFAGLSVGGRVLPVDLGLKEVRYLALAKAGDGFVGFRLRQSGLRGLPSPLWIASFKESRKPDEIAANVTDFTMLSKGNVLYATIPPSRKTSPEHRRRAEVYFHDRAGKSSWNVLDGIESLPELDKAWTQADFVRDNRMVQLIEGFGAEPRPSLVMCFFDHYRGDMRALTLPNEKVVKSEVWRGAILVTHDGRRCLTPLFRERTQPDERWLHHSGKLLTGTYIWDDGPDGRRRRVHLSECTVEIARKEKR